MKKTIKYIISLALCGWLLLSLCVMGAETETFLSGLLCSVGGLISAIMAGYAIYRADKAGIMVSDEVDTY